MTAGSFSAVPNRRSNIAGLHRPIVCLWWCPVAGTEGPSGSGDAHGLRVEEPNARGFVDAQRDETDVIDGCRLRHLETTHGRSLRVASLVMIDDLSRMEQSGDRAIRHDCADDADR